MNTRRIFAILTAVVAGGLIISIEGLSRTTDAAMGMN
jgi:hypothetical protein